MLNCVSLPMLVMHLLTCLSIKKNHPKLRISYGENSSCFKSKKPGQNLTAERSELQILGFRDLEITNFRSLDIRAICLTACINLC